MSSRNCYEYTLNFTIGENDMPKIKTALWLLLVTIVWTGYLFLSPQGWKSLYLALRAILNIDYRKPAIQRWMQDDKKVNAWFGGSKLQTISGRIGYRAISGMQYRWLFAQKIINAIFWFDADHCFTSINWLLYPGLQDQLTQRYNRIYHNY